MPETVNVCKKCNRRMQWMEVRKQWGRAIQHGYTREQATAVTPLCTECMTEFLKDRLHQWDDEVPIE